MLYRELAFRKAWQRKNYLDIKLSTAKTALYLTNVSC